MIFLIVCFFSLHAAVTFKSLRVLIGELLCFQKSQRDKLRKKNVNNHKCFRVHIILYNTIVSDVCKLTSESISSHFYCCCSVHIFWQMSCTLFVLVGCFPFLLLFGLRTSLLKSVHNIRKLLIAFMLVIAEIEDFIIHLYY